MDEAKSLGGNVGSRSGKVKDAESFDGEVTQGNRSKMSSRLTARRQINDAYAMICIKTFIRYIPINFKLNPEICILLY